MDSVKRDIPIWKAIALLLIVICAGLLLALGVNLSRDRGETRLIVGTNDGRYIEDTREVYVCKSSGKIHLHKNCSGMKDYWVMVLDEARDRGYQVCQNCF